MRPTQRPTVTGIRVRSTRDANFLFHAVACGILPMVTRRLDAADRAALRPGCVYIWEERSPASDATGAGMERFTEGRHWHPSRVRDDFLLYVEKDWDANDTERNRMLRQHRESYSSTSYQFQPPRRQPLVKQTYSAWVNTGTNLKKWHMNAYYTEDALEELLTVDDIPLLANLPVPHECYQRARSSTVGPSKKAERGPREPLLADASTSFGPRRNSISAKSQRSSLDPDQTHSQAYSPYTAHPRYSPFPPSPVSTIASSSQSHSLTHIPCLVMPKCPADDRIYKEHPTRNEYTNSSHGFETQYKGSTQFSLPSPSPSPSTASARTSSLPSPTIDDTANPTLSSVEPITSGAQTYPPSDVRSLVPLDRLRPGNLVHRREPADDQILRSFRPL